MYAQEFNPGDRVVVREGYPGTVLTESVGIDFTHYYVMLDNGQGEGWWSENEMERTAMTATAAHTAEIERRLAAEDYPEIGALLEARPDYDEVMDETAYLSGLARTAFFLPLDGGAQPKGSHGYRKGWEDAVGNAIQAPDQDDPRYMADYALGWARGIAARGTQAQPSTTDDLPVLDGLMPELRFNPDMGGPNPEHRISHKEAGLWDTLTGDSEPVGQWEPGRNWSHDACRFRRNSHCYFPRNLNREASEEAGYAVWVPEDRGFCKRVSHDAQRACPLYEPGPNEPGGLTDATIAWEAGGQRGGVPGEKIAKAQVDPKVAAWVDVQSKAKGIYDSGGVRVVSAIMQDDGLHPATFYGQVQGDNGVYDTGLDFVPGTFQLAAWTCTCEWNNYAWGRTRQWVKYEGRVCSHALALIYTMQSQGMSGMPDDEDEIAPDWVGEKTAARGTLKGRINGRVVNLEFDGGQIFVDGNPYTGDVEYPTYHPTLGLIDRTATKEEQMHPTDPDAWGLFAPAESESKDDSRTASITTTAAAVFSAAEQAAIINEGEGVRASNLSALDLTGTHYAPLETYGEDPEDDTFLWTM